MNDSARAILHLLCYTYTFVEKPESFVQCVTYFFRVEKLKFLTVSFKHTYPCYSVNNQADKSPYIFLFCFRVWLLFEESKMH